MSSKDMIGPGDVAEIGGNFSVEHLLEWCIESYTPSEIRSLIEWLETLA